MSMCILSFRPVTSQSHRIGIDHRGEPPPATMVSTVYCIPYPIICLPSRLRSSARVSRGRLGFETLVRRTADVLARRNYRTKRIGQVDAFVACPGAPFTSDLEVTRCFLSFTFFCFIHSFILAFMH